MQRLDDTIGYAVRTEGRFEVRIVDVNGDQTRVSVDGSAEVFDNLKWVSERIRAEKRPRVS